MDFFIDDSLEIKELDLFLAKPNKKIIGHFFEIEEVTLKNKLGNLNELSFSVPYFVDRKVANEHKLIKNPIIDQIRSRFLIKAIYDDKEEWFMIDEINDTSNENGEKREVHCFSLGIELNDKILESINETSKDLRYMAELALQETIWELGEVDNELLGVYRSFEIEETTVLNLIYEIATTFHAIIIWDTVNRKIHFKASDNVGSNLGLRFNYGQYLRSLDREITSNEMVTRLVPRGKDGLTIRSVSPNGADYIDDFSYFMFPFERDENKNVIKSSYFMSDSLCHALLDYQELIEQHEGVFSQLLEERNNLTASLLSLENQLIDLQTELKQIEDSIDVELSNNRDASELIQQKEELLLEIESKEAEIENVQNELEQNQNEMNNLQDILSVENNFTKEQLFELNPYIIKKTWTDEYIIDPQDLLKEAKKAFKVLRKPQKVFSLDVVSFIQMLEGKKDWGKLRLGDTVYVHHDVFNEDFIAKIIEFEIDFNNQTISLTISDTTEILNEEEEYYKRLYEGQKAATFISLNKDKISQFDKVNNKVEEYLNSNLDASKQEIIAGTNESVIINHRGITISDSEDPLRLIRMTNSVIGLSKDGMDTLQVAISPDGIFANQLVGEILVGENLIIDASNSHGTSIFRVDASGVLIDGSSLTIQDSGNGITLDPEDGIVINREDNKIRTLLNANDGFTIQKNTFTSGNPNWEDLLYADTDGNLVANNLITRKLSIRDELDNIVIDADAGIIDFSKFPFKYGVLDTSNIPEINASKITTGTLTSTVSLYGNYIYAAEIESGSIRGSNIYGANIQGGVITSDTSINISTDAYIGNYLYLGDRDDYYSTKSVIFNNSARINSYGFAGINVSANEFSVEDGSEFKVDMNNTYLYSNVQIYGSLSVNGSSVSLSGHNHDGRYVRIYGSNDIWLQIATGGINVYKNGSYVGYIPFGGSS